MAISYSGLCRLISPKAAALAFSALALNLTSAHALEIHVYGPGGPAPAMQEAAKIFSANHGVTVKVAAGPTPQWIESARKDADIVYSGAENMMSDFAKAMPDQFNLSEADPLYVRPAAILVRPGNPKNIHGFEDLLRPGVKVIAVAGAGQTGLWEDVAGRTGSIDTIRSFRRNLVLPEAANSAVARELWTKQPDIDAWLIWNIWQVSNPTLAEQVPVEERYRIYRDMGVVLTAKGRAVQEARDFIAFLKSDEGRKVFEKWGWQ